jgi:glycosyltransferase involved in cell wall biosynthesis
MTVWYKDFPPGWGHLKIPLSSRNSALAALALHAPCRRRARLIQRAAWAIIKVVGPTALPGRAIEWSPAVDRDVWQELSALLQREVGAFDGVAGYERLQRSHPGFALLLLRDGVPVSFVKLRYGDGAAVANEYQALHRVARYAPRSFSVPRPRAHGELHGWHFLAIEPLTPRLHRPASKPPLGLITAEIQDALADLPRCENTPAHWRPMHGDFAPWNLRTTPGGPVLIDWEDAGWGPPGADEVFYLSTQAALDLGDTSASVYDEAIAYWDRKVAGRRDTKRDITLATGVCDALRRMRVPVAANNRAAHPCVDSVRSSDAGGDCGTTRNAARPRALVFAYACEPGRGSEPGAGWGLAQAASELADCVVLTAAEHLPGIRRWEAATPGSSMRFIEVPEPGWAPLAKRHRLTWFLLYAIWLRRAQLVGRSLHATTPFDLVYHATYSVYWLPSPAPTFGIPAIWGGVGGAVTTPLTLWPFLGLGGLLDEMLDYVAVRALALLPSTRRTWKRAAVRVVQNEATLAALPQALHSGTWLLNHALFTEIPDDGVGEGGRDVLIVSALESRKGVALALHALSHTTDVRLTIVGDGPRRHSLERLARRLGVAGRVTFRGRAPRSEVFALLRSSAAAVFTGLREEGGLALAEAMLCGVPVIVLGNGGARTIAASGTDATRVALIEPGRPNETARRMGEAMTAFSQTAPTASTPLLDQAAAKRVLRAAFEQAARAAIVRDPNGADG